jgi:hypothetical protein
MELDPDKVRKGRKDEMEFMTKIDIFEFVKTAKCWERTGAAPISTRWVEGEKKDDDGELIVRCRLVGRDFKPKCEKDREDLFAAMPPLEVKKLLFRMTAAERRTRRRTHRPELKLMFIDVSEAHLNAFCNEEVYVELPEDFERPGECGRLKRWLYGMRPAASGWEDHYTDKLESEKFVRGVAAPTVFYNEGTGVRVVVHGDDFTFSGEEDALLKIKNKMEEWYAIKLRGIMGSALKDIKEIVILGRTLRWTDDGLEYIADEKHRQELMKSTGMG